MPNASPTIPSIFTTARSRCPALLKSAGYRTAALGKWHNGFGRAPEPDWNGELKPGPLEIGFDYFFGTPRTHNEPPLVFVENHRVIGLDPADPISMDKTKGPHGKMFGGAKGPGSAARRSDRFHPGGKGGSVFRPTIPKDAPFFLYLAFAAPHVPIDPAPEFRGRSQVGLYGDYVQQLDHCTGLVLDALEKLGFSQNTLVIFTSDNGGMFTRDAVEAAHRCNGVLLGQKTDAWEGGHRVPLIARWPGHIPTGSVRKALFSQVDIMATLAEAAGVPLPPGASPDGAGDLAAFTDPAQAPAKRSEALFLGTGGFALRQGDWVYMPKQGSGGMTVQVPAGPLWGQPYASLGMTNSDVDPQGQIKPGAPPEQLYNLGTDLPQSTNIVTQEPSQTTAMKNRIQELVPQAHRPPKPKPQPAAKP